MRGFSWTSASRRRMGMGALRAFSALTAVLGASEALAQSGSGAIFESVMKPRDWGSYVGCDGYGAPTREGDGMTHFAMNLRVFNVPGQGNTMRQDASFAGEGVVDCDSALAALPAKHWRRRVSLYTARAVHDLERRDARQALIDVERAQAAAQAQADPFYARSMGLNLEFVRAYALRQAGRSGEAHDLALHALQARPFRKRASLATAQAIGLDSDDTTTAELLRRGAALDPHELDRLFQWEVSRGDFTEAEKVWPGLIPPRGREAPPEMTEAEFRQDQRIGVALFWMSRDCQHAYVLAALHRTEEAQAALAAARKRLEAATQNLIDTGRGREADEHILEANANARARNIAEPEFKRYGLLIAAWRTLLAGRPAEAMESVRDLPIDAFRHDLDVAALAALGQSPPSELSASAITEATDNEVTSLWKNNLAEIESAERLPGHPGLLNPAGHAAVRELASNAHDPAPPEPGAVRIHSHLQRGPTLDMVGDLVLLRAAEVGREQGKKGMIILRRNDVRHIFNTYDVSTPVRSDPTGFESDIDVLYVDPASLPAAYAATPWRVLDVDAVYADLAPIYRREPSRSGHLL